MAATPGSTSAAQRAISLTAEEYARLMDHLERDDIRHVVVRYARGADRLDEGLTRGAYWPDGYDNHGLFRGNAQEFVTWARQLGAANAGMQHTLGQSLIELLGDRARCETYFLFCSSASRETPTDDLAMLGGRYVDILDKRDGIWKIAHRDVVIDWSANIHDVDRFPGVEEFTAGDFEPNDYSYRPIS
jgi:SnoaL-like domain